MSRTIKNILLCSHNPIFIKGIYGHLRDAGYCVDTCEHPADAVKAVIGASYTAVILDSGDIGLNAEDAAAIIKTVRPDIHITVIGRKDDWDGMNVIDGTDAIDHIKDILKDIAVIESKGNNKGGVYDTERNCIKSI